jgi:membrane protein involved in colicin uptake
MEQPQNFDPREILPTVKVVSGDSYIVINASDFDPAKHEKWLTAEERAAAQKAAADQAAADKAAADAAAKAQAEADKAAKGGKKE